MEYRVFVEAEGIHAFRKARKIFRLRFKLFGGEHAGDGLAAVERPVAHGAVADAPPDEVRLPLAGARRLDTRTEDDGAGRERFAVLGEHKFAIARIDAVDARLGKNKPFFLRLLCKAGRERFAVPHERGEVAHILCKEQLVAEGLAPQPDIADVEVFEGERRCVARDAPAHDGDGILPFFRRGERLDVHMLILCSERKIIACCAR